MSTARCSGSRVAPSYQVTAASSPAVGVAGIKPSPPTRLLQGDSSPLEWDGGRVSIAVPGGSDEQRPRSDHRSDASGHVHRPREPGPRGDGQRESWRRSPRLVTADRPARDHHGGQSPKVHVIRQCRRARSRRDRRLVTAHRRSARWSSAASRRSSGPAVASWTMPPRRHPRPSLHRRDSDPATRRLRSSTGPRALSVRGRHGHDRGTTPSARRARPGVRRDRPTCQGQPAPTVLVPPLAPPATARRAFRLTGPRIAGRHAGRRHFPGLATGAATCARRRLDTSPRRVYSRAARSRRPRPQSRFMFDLPARPRRPSTSPVAPPGQRFSSAAGPAPDDRSRYSRPRQSTGRPRAPQAPTVTVPVRCPAARDCVATSRVR